MVIGACGGGADTESSVSTAGVTTTGAAPSATTPASRDTVDPGGTTQSSEETTYASDDGVLTIVVPAGAATDGITIAPADQADLPAELAALTVPVYAYELSPDGTEFSEPVQVTYRIPVADLSPMSDSGVPWVLLLSATTDQELELYDTIEISREGDEVVVTGTTTHFSHSVAVVDNVEIELESNPDPVSLPVGASFGVRIDNVKGLSTLVRRGAHTEGVLNWFYGSKTPVTFVEEVGDGALYTCTSVSDGFVPDAFTADVQLNNDTFDSTIRYGDAFLAIFGDIDLANMFLDVFGVATKSNIVAHLSGAAECRDLAPGETIPADVPAALQAAAPISAMLVDVADGGGGGTVEVEFRGDARTLFEGGSLNSANIDVHVSEGTVRVSLNYSVVDGVAETRGIHTDLADAVPTEDGTGSTISSTSGNVTAEWAAENRLNATITGVEVPAGASIEVQVLLRETPDGELHSLVLRPS